MGIICLNLAISPIVFITYFCSNRINNNGSRAVGKGGATGALAPPQRPKRSTFLLITPSIPLFYSLHFFTRSLTLVPRCLLPNRTETLAEYASYHRRSLWAPCNYKRGGPRILFFFKEIKVCIVPFLCGTFSLRIV